MSKQKMKDPVLQLGKLVATPTVMESVGMDEVFAAIDRHIVGDWGDLEPSDHTANDEAVLAGDRVLSAYKSATGVKFWIITESDRSVTTALLPSDY